jgi:uncharacterized protein YdeI (YjbR/CyaY-like superfamily)
MSSTVDVFFNTAKQWRDEMSAFRAILLDCNLTEELKWGKPCYMSEGKNIIILQPFKGYCALGFFNGALLKDDKHLLVKPGENTQGGRQIRFTQLQEIIKMKDTLKSYIIEAIKAEKAGLKVEPVDPTKIIFSDELKYVLGKNAAFKKAFSALTPGRQRAYNMFFSAPKQSKTRETRIEKYMNQIMDGKGINDCTCGLSKKMPYCDGSHKYK